MTALRRDKHPRIYLCFIHPRAALAKKWAGLSNVNHGVGPTHENPRAPEGVERAKEGGGGSEPRRKGGGEGKRIVLRA